MRICVGIFVSSLLFIATRGNDEIGKVMLSPDHPIIYSELGGTITVDCSVIVKTGQTTRPVWNNPPGAGNVEIRSTQSNKDEKTTIYSSVTIKNVQDNNLGAYKCTYGSSEASFILEAPVEDKSGATFEFGDKSAILHCSIEKASEEGTKLEWFKNDTLVSKLVDKERFVENAENRTLTISNPTRDDADLYILRFTFKEGIPAYNCKVPYKATPYVLKFDKSKNLIEDDTMELQCQVKGYPRATVQWLKDNQNLNSTDNQRIMMSPLNGYKNARLVIKNVKFDDAGDYTCKAHSTYFNQSVSKELVVRVKDKLAALWPFLGIVGEVVILCTIIFIYEKRRNKQAESDSNNVQDVDGSTADKKEGLRHRNTSNNPTA